MYRSRAIVTSLVIAQLVASVGMFLSTVTNFSWSRWATIHTTTAIGLALLILGSLYGPLGIRNLLLAIRERAFAGYWRARIVIVGMAALTLTAIVGAFSVMSKETAGAIGLYGVCSLVWLPTSLAILLMTVDAKQHRATRFVKRSAGLLVSAVVGLTLFELGLQIAWDHLPSAITASMPQAPVRYGIRYDLPYGAREYPANEAVWLKVDRFTGDLYHLSCLQPPIDEPEPPYVVQYQRDDHGFRNTTPWPERVDLVVIGDSYVAAEAVARPFWQDISRSTLDLGLPGTGAAEQVATLREFGLPRSPNAVIMTYYEGNDLGDNWLYHQARKAGISIYELTASQKPWDYLVTIQLVKFLQARLTPKPAAKCAYPVADAEGHQLAFHSMELALSTIDAQMLRKSVVYDITRKAIKSAAADVNAQGAEFVLAFIPHKAHTYWSQLVEANLVKTISGTTAALVPAADGLILDDNLRSTPEIAALIMANIDAQRELMAELAAQEGFAFLDFTPAFQAASHDPETLYFYGDTHWNQRGNDLAREVLRNFLVEGGWLRDAASYYQS